MDYQFTNPKMERLYYEGDGTAHLPAPVVKAFFKKMQQIVDASNENDLRAMKSNHFEKLAGETNKYSIRLNQGYRLIFSLQKGNNSNIIEILEISNHYS